MKIFLHLIFFLQLVMGKETDTEQVYICISRSAVAYHKSEDACRGIKACTHEIRKVSKSDAIRKYKYRACKICY